MTRSPGVKPSRPADVSCAGSCAPHGAGLHTPAASAVVLGAAGPRKELMFKGGMQHTMGWPYEDAENTLHRGQGGDRVMGREGIRPLAFGVRCQSPSFDGFHRFESFILVGQ